MSFIDFSNKTVLKETVLHKKICELFKDEDRLIDFTREQVDVIDGKTPIRKTVQSTKAVGKTPDAAETPKTDIV